MREPFLSFFRHGVDPGFASLPPLDIDRNNYPMPDVIAAAALANVQCLLDKRFVEEVPSPPRIINSMFAVPKPPLPNGTLQCRNVVDCSMSMLNSCLFSIEMRLPTIRDTIRLAGIGWWAAKFDLKDGFFHIPIHPDWVDCFGIRLPGTRRFARYRVLVFGASVCPAVFQLTMLELRAMLFSLGFKCFIVVYIDDFLVLAPTQAAAIHGAIQFKAFMRACGITLHPDKETAPCQALPFTGVNIDFKTGTLSMPSTKSTAYAELVADVSRGAKVSQVPLKTLDSLLGKLAHVEYVVKGGKQALAPLYADRARALRLLLGSGRRQGRLPPWCTAHLSSQSKSSLTWWHKRLMTPGDLVRRLFVYANGRLDCFDDETCPYPLPAPAGVIHIVGDASAGGWGFIITFPDSRRIVRAGAWSPEEQVRSSNWRESRTIVLALKATRPLLLPHQTVAIPILVDSDNKTAVACTNALYSRTAALRPLCHTLKNELSLFPRPPLLAARHRPGIHNGVADALSRAAVDILDAMELAPEFIATCTALLPNTTLLCPPASSRKKAIQRAVRTPGRSNTTSILLPFLEADHHWLRLLARCYSLKETISPKRVYASAATVYPPYGASPFTINAHHSDRWQLWAPRLRPSLDPRYAAPHTLCTCTYHASDILLSDATVHPDLWQQVNNSCTTCTVCLHSMCSSTLHEQSYILLLTVQRCTRTHDNQ
jgi:hypothetical protein